MRKLLVVSIALLLLVPLYPLTVGEESQTRWTIMIYMGGGVDMGISEQVENDLAEIEEGVPGDQVEVIVLADQFEDGDSRLLYHTSEGLVEIPLSSVNQTWDDEVDMSDPQSLRDFVMWSKGNHPAERYMLYLWGHGDGWRGMPVEDGGDLFLTEMEEALNGIKVDVLGFDSCSMGTFELYYQLRKKADIILASPLDIPMQGLPYDIILDRMGEKPDMGTEEVAEMIVEEFVVWSFENTDIDTGLMAVATDRLPVDEFVDYTEHLSFSLPYYHGRIWDAWNETEPGCNEERDIYEFSINVDSFVDCGRFKNKGIELREAIDGSILFQNTTQRERLAMSVYFPRASPFHYDTLSFVETGWSSWLAKFSGPRPDISDPPYFDVELDGKDLSFSFQHNLTEGSVELDIWDKDGYMYRETFYESSHEFTTELTPGLYHVDAYLRDHEGLHHHTHEEVLYEEEITMVGTVEPDEVKVHILNTARDIWMNRTLKHGNYSISLLWPSFCEPGDMLEITYVHGKYEETFQRDVPYEGDLTVDFASIETEDQFPWITVVIFLSGVALVAVYLKRRFMNDGY